MTRCEELCYRLTQGEPGSASDLGRCRDQPQSKGRAMNLFLSWSGRVSHDVAIALQKWLPYMLHSVKPIISNDIRTGSDWREELVRQLRGAEYGVVCVTPFNIHKPWMNFEAGALAGHLKTLTPFLFLVDRAALGNGPLATVELAEFRRNDQRDKQSSTNS